MFFLGAQSFPAFPRGRQETVVPPKTSKAKKSTTQASSIQVRSVTKLTDQDATDNAREKCLRPLSLFDDEMRGL